MSYFEPWVGSRYEANRVLLLSESTYKWLAEDGEILTPQPDHPKGSVEWNIEHFGKNRYFTSMNRALCMAAQPTVADMRTAWEDYAYSIYVQEPVGLGAGVRPTKEHWQGAGSHFRTLLEELRPLKVLVTGKDMWDVMPECDVRLLDDLQAYRLADGSLTWCLALPHPANRRAGFKWDAIGESIKVFKAAKFPSSSQL